METIRAKPFNVNQIKIISQSLLKSYDYKDGFPVLKELIQNADDAQSSELRIINFEGIPTAKHPLLRRKGIFVYDNGIFSSITDTKDPKDSNEYGVLSIGGTDKDDDIEKIGKYGLGMKSIFHICDAFFYYINKENRLGAINPFADNDGIDNLHPEWTELIEQDQILLINEIKQNISESFGFTIIIPDGMPEDKQITANNGKRDINIEQPFNKDDVGNKNLISNLTNVLALLPKVSTYKDKFQKIVFYNPKKQNRLIIKTDIVQSERTITANENKKEIYKAKYSLFEENQFVLEEGEQIWKFLKDNNAISSDKITSKHSVCYELIKSPPKSAKAKLYIKYCVYLPLQKPENLEIEIDASYDFTLLINGSFLIDEGRKGIESFEYLAHDDYNLTFDYLKNKNIHNTGIVTEIWNLLIAQYVVFPNLPKIFENAISDELISSKECETLIHGLKTLAEKDKNILNSYSSKVYGFAEVYDFEKKKISWKIINKNTENYIYFPKDFEIRNFFEIFPFLLNCRNSCFINGSNEDNYILSDDYNPNTGILYELISQIKVDSLLTRNNIKCLAAFIKNNTVILQTDEKLQKCIIGKIKKLVINYFDELSEKAALSELFNSINYVCDKSIYRIFAINDTQNIITNEEWKTVWKTESPFVFIPGNYNIQNNYSKELLLNDINSICSFIKSLELSDESQFTILDGINALKSYFEDISEKYPELCIYELFDVSLNKEKCINTTIYKKKLDNKEIFSGQPVGNHPLRTLAKLIQKESVLSVRKDNISKYKIPTINLLESTKENIIQYLFMKWSCNQNLYINDEYKTKFIDEIFHADTDKIQINGNNKKFFKSLLTGFSNVEQDTPIYYITAKKEWKFIFEKCCPEKKVIPYTGIDSFLIENYKLLNISFVTDVVCFNELRDYAKFAELDFILNTPELNSLEFKEDVFGKMDKNDSNLFLKLPYQIDTLSNKIIHQIDNNCYLNIENIKLPDECGKGPLKLIALSPNPKEQDFQETFFKEKYFTKAKAIQTIIENNDSITFIDDIFSIIEQSATSDLDEIRNISWIPVNNNTKTSINKIINPSLLHEETQYELIKFTHLVKISSLRLSDKNIETIKNKKLYSRNIKELFSVLKFELEKIENNFYIPVDNLNELKTITELFKLIFPIYMLINALLNDSGIKNGNEEIFNLYKDLNIKTNSFENNIKAINEITKRPYEESILKFYNYILRRVCNIPQFQINQISYPSISGQWKNADELTAYNNSRIAPEYLLNNETFNILKDKLNEIKSSGTIIQSLRGPQLKFDSPIKDIKTFFNTWENAAEHKELVAFFMYLLRDNFRKAIQPEYDSFCFNKIEKAEEFQYQVRQNELFWSSGFNQQEAFGDSSKKYFKTYINIQDADKHIITRSISKKNIRVKILDKSGNSSVMIGEPDYSNYAITMSLLPKSKEEKKDDSFVITAINRVFNRCYKQYSHEEISRFINNIINESQNTIKEAEEIILEEAFVVLQMLGVKHPVFIKYRNARQESKRKRSNTTYDRDKRINNEKYFEDKEKIEIGLKNEVTTNKDLQKNIFESVKKKITQHQYNKSSVLFEFFQNADDSVNDLVLCERELNEDNKTFSVIVGEREITISHYGRIINDTLNNSEYKDKFSQDLYNMITLNSSVKSEETGDTGKFGLGFKSVYTICNKPIVHSGNLDFRIIAGIYPEITDRITLSPGETKYVLQGDFIESKEEICSKFQKNIFYLAVFSKQIRNIEIKGLYKASIKLEPKELFKNDSGTKLVSSISDGKYEYLLFQDTQINYKVLFRLRDNHINQLTDSELPKTWNVTPLNSASRLPFLINANFIVDAGRINLDRKLNDELLIDISKSLSELIIKSKDFFERAYSKKLLPEIIQSFITTYNLQDQTFKDFADSILKTFYCEFHFIPNGFGEIINISEKLIYFSINSGLFTDYKENDFLMAVRAYLKRFNEKNELITQSIAEIYKDSINSVETNLSELLELLPEKKLQNDDLESFIKICNCLRYNYSVWKDIQLSEYKLQNIENNWIKADLILLDDDLDSDNIISSSYSTNVINFLKTNSLFANNRSKYFEETANEKDRRNNELEQRNAELQQLLNKIQNYYNPDNADGTENVLEPKTITDELLNEQDFYEYQPSKSITQLYEEWHAKTEQERKDAASKYYSNLLPDSVNYTDFLSSDIELSDSEWFILFILAIYQSRPFCRDLNNKSFLNKLDKQDKTGHLLEKLGENKPSKNPQVWIDVILDFLDGKSYEQEYFSWFNEFAKMVEMSEWKDVYMQILGDMNRLPEKEKHNILTPEAINEYSGTGLRKAPTIDRTIRIGFSLIIRELIRKGILNPEKKVDKFAFMPKARCIKFVLGETSDPHSVESTDLYKRIIEEIGEEKARFDGYYDIPLLLEVKPGERL